VTANGYARAGGSPAARCTLHLFPCRESGFP